MSDAVSPEPEWIGALDQGTTSTRFILFSSKGEFLCQYNLDHETFAPHNGWAEQNPLEILERAKSCIDECVCLAGEKHGVFVSQIKSIGITNQRETLVVWKKDTGQPLYNAIVWHDTRTADTCVHLRQQIDSETVRSITGLPISGYFTGVKLRWMMDNVAEVRAAIEDGTAMFGTVDTWLVWNLTKEKVHVTDITNAGRTMMMNIKTGEWDQRMLGVIGVNPAILPEIKSCSEVFGHMDGTSLDGVRIAGLIGDQQSALVGQSCFQRGMAKNTYGTGCFLIVNTGEEIRFSKNGLLTTPAYKMGPNEPCVYSLEGSVASGGVCVQWLRDEMNLIGSASESETIGLQVENTGDVYLVPAFSGLFAPEWDSSARGTIVGMTLSTGKAHVVRATLEGIAFTVNDVLRSAAMDMGEPLSELRVDGGASINNLLMQTQADIAGVDVVRPRVVETTALGAAFCAGHAVGMFQSTAEFCAQWEEGRRFTPGIPEEARKDRLCRWNAAVERSQGWFTDAVPATGGGWSPSKEVILTAILSSCAAALFTVAMCKVMTSKK